MRICLASDGYGGCGKLIALAVSTPCETFSVEGGFTTMGTGGGVVSSTLTTGAVPLQVTQPLELLAAVGGSTFRFPKTKSLVTGGIVDALVPTLSGTFVGSLVGAIASVRIGTLTFLSTGAFGGA